MWVRLKSDGTAAYIPDLTAAFAMIDAGEAEAVDELPDRPADYGTAVISPPETAIVKPKPKPKARSTKS